MSADQKIPESLKEQTFRSKLFVYARRSIGRLFRIILLICLKAAKLLLHTDQSQLLLLVRFIFLTALYLANDLVQFVLAFVFIWYVYRCLRDSFVIWSAKNAELVVDFTSDRSLG